MAFNAVFYSFNKKQNSTKQPGSGISYKTLSVVLKDNCSVVNPILRVHSTISNWNPSDYNYCYINTFARYYWVNDWIYNLGEWECNLKCDVLATYKAGIGSLSKYVLRSSAAYNSKIVDEFYPLLAQRPTSNSVDSYQFWGNNSLADGTFIVGIANSIQSNTGAICYYLMNSVQMHNLIDYILPQTSDLWSNGFSGMTDTLYKSIYSPFDYIKVCKWFPFTIVDDVSTRDYIVFGNYTSTIKANTIDSHFSNWEQYNHRFSLPSDWIDLDAKYRTQPNCHLYFKLNPWGIIELNPLDFHNSRYLKAYIDIDYLSGDALLRLYKEYGGTEEFITQSVAKFGVDIQLTASSLNLMGMLTGAVGAVGAVAGAFLGAPFASILSTAASAGSSMVQGLTPTMQGSAGQQAGSASFLDGNADLILVLPYYAGENNAEFGKPLFDTRTLSTIPGFIKCADSECEAAGAMYFEEREEIGQHLMNGFYYE